MVLSPLQGVVTGAGVVLLLVVGFLVRKSSHWQFVYVLILFLIAGLLLLYCPLPYVGDGTRKSLGDALVVSAIVAFTADRYIKERVLREVSADVSKYLIGYRLPGEVQDRIRFLLQQQWIRRNFHLRCRLTEIGNRPGFVKLEITVSDEIQNITEESLDYRDHIEYERHDEQRILELRCESEDPKAAYVLRGQDLAKEKRDEPGVMIAVGKKVKIPPVIQVMGRTYRFIAKYEIIHPEKYSDEISFSRPTIGAVLEFDCPQDFQFSAPTADVSSEHKWEYKRLFMPGENIRFRWEKRTVAAARMGE